MGVLQIDAYGTFSDLSVKYNVYLNCVFIILDKLAIQFINS